MFKLKGPRDERGISEVLGAILILGMVISVGSVAYAQYVQSSIHSAEASSMGAVGEAFIKLKSAIAAMGIGQSSIANIPMNPSYPALIPTSGEVGTLSLLPGIAYHKGATSYTIMNNEGHVSGSLNALKANDDDYLEINQVIFNEKFPNTSGWTMHEVLPDNGGDAFFDTYSHTGDGTGSISVITSGATTGYYDRRGRWHRGRPINTPENAYWEHDFGDSLDNYPNVTLQAWFGKETDYSIPPTTDNAAWWIEVETNESPENQTLYAHQEYENISFVAVGTGSGVQGNPTPAYPAGLRANDLILLQVTVRDTTNTPTPLPENFTLLYGPDSTGTGRQWIYYKFSDGTESGTITVTIGGNNCKIACMYAFRNVNLSSFTEGESFGSGTDSTIDARSVTTTGVNRLAVSFVFVNDDDSVGSFTGETGGDWTEATSEFTTTQGSDGCVQLQTATMASAGTISGGSYTMGASDPWGVRAFALIPSEKYKLLKTIGADTTGTNLSVSTVSAGRSDNQLWGRFVYPLTGLRTIPASLWNLYYRSWYSVEPSSTTNSPTSTSGGWTNPTDAYDNGDNNAYVTSGTPSASENYNGYGFNIPAGSTIASVRVRYDAWALAPTITYVGAGAKAAGTSGVTPVLPTGWQENDIFLLFCETANDAVTAPSGWTAVDNSPQGTAGTRLTVFWRRATTSETAPTITDPGDHICAGILAFRGVVTTGNPWDVTAGNVASASTSVTIPGATTSVDNCMVVVAVANGYETNNSQTSNWTNANLTDLTERVDYNTDSGNGGGFGVATGTKSTAGNYGSTTATLANSLVQGRMSIALKPAMPKIRVDVSWNGGTSWSAKQENNLTTTETTYWYDVTGATGWTPAKLNDDNFRVRVDAVTVGSPSVVRLDWIPVEVTYTDPTAAPVAHADISIRIIKSDNRWYTIAANVAGSSPITSTEDTYSVTYPFGGYTVENDDYYLEIDYYCHVVENAPGTAYLKIDNNSLAPADQTRVESVLFTYPNTNWNTVLSYAVSTRVDELNGIPFWYKKSTLQTLENGIANGITKIRAHMYDNLRPYNADAIDTYLSTWTDEITLFDGPPFDVDTVLTSMPIIAPESVDNIVGNLAFWSNSPAYYTLQIENSTGGWENFKTVRLDNVDQNKVYWVETIGGASATTLDNNPRNYIYNNVINIRITGHSDDLPFSLCLDYLDFEVNYKEDSENYLASFYGGSGRLTFTMINYSYPNQTYVYDDGAVIVAQLNSSAMASGGAPTPDLVYVEPGDGNNIKVYVNHFVLTGFGSSSISRRGWSAIRTTVVDSYYLNQGVNVPNVSIEMYTSPYTDQAWVNYLSGLCDDFNARGYNSRLDVNPLTDTGGEHLTLTIQGNYTDNTTLDIFYYETITEVQVQLA